MKPFFSFYGGKWRAAPRYPAPLHGSIVEPFAGSAGYSVRYYDRDITLVDADPLIAGLWDYLIHVPSSEIRRLPAVVEHVDEMSAPQEARWLVGFWLNKGMYAPCLTPSKWMREQHGKDGRLNTYWGEGVRDRIASQVENIRHWRIINGQYEAAPFIEATWFIDPPYNCEAGRRYKRQVHSYVMLAKFCRTRPGQIIVCEKEGADWLPFKPFMDIKSLEGKHGHGKSPEVIWIGE